MLALRRKYRERKISCLKRTLKIGQLYLATFWTASSWYFTGNLPSNFATRHFKIRLDVNLALDLCRFCPFTNWCYVCEVTP